MPLLVITLALLRPTFSSEPLKRAVVWTGAGSPKDLRETSRSDFVRYLRDSGGLAPNQIHVRDFDHESHDSHTLEEVAKEIREAMDEAVARDQDLDLTLALNGHGAIDQAGQLHMDTRPAGSDVTEALPLTRFLDLLDHEFTTHPQMENRLRINVIVSACNSGHCGLAPVGHPISSRHLKLTVLGFTGLNQQSYGDRDGYILDAIATIDRRLRERGIDLCPGCSWFERTTRMVHALPVWFSSFDMVASGPTVFGSTEVTRALSDDELIHFASEIMHYQFGRFSLFAIARIMANRSPAERSRLARKIRKWSTVYPVLLFPWHIANRQYARAFEPLLDITGRADLKDWGSSQQFERLIAMGIDPRLRPAEMPVDWRATGDLGTRLKDRWNMLASSGFCEFDLVGPGRVHKAAKRSLKGMASSGRQ